MMSNITFSHSPWVCWPSVRAIAVDFVLRHWNFEATLLSGNICFTTSVKASLVVNGILWSTTNWVHKVSARITLKSSFSEAKKLVISVVTRSCLSSALDLCFADSIWIFMSYAPLNLMLKSELHELHLAYVSPLTEGTIKSHLAVYSVKNFWCRTVLVGLEALNLESWK